MNKKRKCPNCEKKLKKIDTNKYICPKCKKTFPSESSKIKISDGISEETIDTNEGKEYIIEGKLLRTGEILIKGDVDKINIKVPTQNLPAGTVEEKKEISLEAHISKKRKKKEKKSSFKESSHIIRENKEKVHTSIKEGFFKKFTKIKKKVKNKLKIEKLLIIAIVITLIILFFIIFSSISSNIKNKKKKTNITKKDFITLWQQAGDFYKKAYLYTMKGEVLYNKIKDKKDKKKCIYLLNKAISFYEKALKLGKEAWEIQVHFLMKKKGLSKRKAEKYALLHYSIYQEKMEDWQKDFRKAKQLLEYAKSFK